MKIVVQRVHEAKVTVGGDVAGQIGAGLLILVGVRQGDTDAEAAWLARKCASLRIFPDDEGKMNRSVLDAGGEVLVVSQFTLYGDAQKGNRPSFVASAAPEEAERLYECFLHHVEKTMSKAPARGVFGAMMDVHLVNHGPVTILIERNPAE